jgi:hypothetical protein
VDSLFVFCADTHLADGAWTSRPAIYGDSYYSLQQIVDYCVAAKLPLVIGGDVLDVKRNYATPVQKLCAQMDRMAAAQLPVWYIQGQHELDRSVTWMSVHPWPKHVNKQSFTIGDVKLYGIDWLPRNDIQAAFKEVPPDTDILITHQVWQNLMKNIGRPECSLADVHNVTTVLTGDFHVTVIETAPNAQGVLTQLVSPGSTCMQDISECPDRFFYVIRRAGNGFNAIKRQLVTRRFKAYTITEQSALDALCAGGFAADIKSMFGGLPAEIDKPLIRVKFDKRIPDAHIRISTAIGDAAHLFCDPIVDKSRNGDETNRTVVQNDLISVISELLRDSPAALVLAEALLRAEQPVVELEKQFAQFQSQQETSDAAVAARSE